MSDDDCVDGCADDVCDASDKDDFSLTRSGANFALLCSFFADFPLELHFLNGFSVDSIQGCLDEATEVLTHVHQLPLLAVQQALSVLHKIDLGISQEKGLRIGASEVQVLFSLHAVNAQAVENVVTARTCRRKIMATNFHLGTHLTTSILERARKLSAQRGLKPPPPPSPKDPDVLLHRLVRVVREDLEGRVRECSYSSAELLDTLFNPSTPVIHPLRTLTVFNRRHYSGNDLDDQTAEVVVDILRHWFDLPSDDITRARTTFLEVVLKHLGYAAFLLPNVWEMYMVMPPSMIRSVSNGRLQRLVDALPVSDVSSSAFAKLHRLGQEHQDLARALWEVAHNKQDVPTPPISTNIVDSDFQVDRQIEQDPGPSSSALACSIPSSSGLSFPGSGKVISFLKSAYKVARLLDQGGTTSSPGLNWLEKKVISSADFLLPL